ncbi:MAG TPA: methyltransferase domain-containing protein, partial [Gammaproteobacteria bacterium]|nr:methyltransferase domain-containing protein [Gammaproteobacteria bacterium]
LELLDAKPEHTLLDVGCGLGLLLEAASCYTARLRGIDVSEVAIAEARRRLPEAEVRLGNAECLPYADDSFDLVCCLGSLERMLDAAKALDEMRRVGRTAARYCFLVRNSDAIGWKYLARFMRRTRRLSHAGADSLQNWRGLFESRGFRVIEIWPDQYPLHRLRGWARLGLKRVDFREPMCGRIDHANEFIFILEKEA